MSDSNEIVDIAGIPITPGCLLLYAIRNGSSPTLMWGKVKRTKIIPPVPNTHWIANQYKITIQAIDRASTYDEVTRTYTFGWNLRSGLTTLQYPERTVVVPWENRLPDHVRRLLQSD